MDDSYEAFATHVTELKMDHKDGKQPSDRLTELLS